MFQLTYSFVGLTPPRDILTGVERGEISSFCLFAGQNVESPQQVRDLTEELYAAARSGGQLPPLIGIDQEGGQLVAIGRGATELPGNMALGAARSPELARRAGEVLALELLAMGINVNYAPSLDVMMNPLNPVIGTRSFGDNPELVAELGAAMIKGMQGYGLIATAKHFPGHGDTEGDTHFANTLLTASRQRLESVELLPFRAAVRAGVGAIMTAHVIATQLDPERPATISKAVLTDLLRRQMGFEGLTMTDAMDMHAVARLGRFESVSAALEAGSDLVVLAHLEHQLELAAQVRHLTRPDALRRIQRVRERLPRVLPPLDVVGCREHQAVAQEIADRSITLVKDTGRLPLRLVAADVIAVILPETANLTPADTSAGVHITLAQEIRARHPNTFAYHLPRQATADSIAHLLQAVETAAAVIVGTINADADSPQAELVRELHQRGQQPIVVSLRMPHDILAFPMIETYLCAYSIRAYTMKALTRVLFGDLEPCGQLPCNLPLNVR